MSNQLIGASIDTAIEALDHAVGLRMARPDEAMINAEFCAGQVKCMLARKSHFLAGESVRELKPLSVRIVLMRIVAVFFRRRRKSVLLQSV